MKLNSWAIVGGAVLAPWLLESLQAKPAGRTIATSYDAIHRAAFGTLPIIAGVTPVAADGFTNWLAKVRTALIAAHGSFARGLGTYPRATAGELAEVARALHKATRVMAARGIEVPMLDWFDDSGSSNLTLLAAMLEGVAEGGGGAPESYVPSAMAALGSAAAELDSAGLLLDGRPVGDVSVLDSVAGAVDKLPDTLLSAAESAGGALASGVSALAGGLALSTPVLIGGLVVAWWVYAA